MGHALANIIITPRGERLAVVPADEYEALVDMAQDVRDGVEAEEIMRKVRAGEIEMRPAEIVNRIVFDGENPIRVYRDWRGMTIKQLGEVVGISHAYISQIETGKRQGTFDVMAKIAKALRVNLNDLVTENE